MIFFKTVELSELPFQLIVEFILNVVKLVLHLLVGKW